jgi:hypothetical protein
MLSAKQEKTLWYLESETFKHVEDVFFGGSAGGGKSFLGCLWQIERRRKYPGTRGMIGRSKLKNLKLTTLKTLFEIWKNEYEGRFKGFEMNLNNQDNVIYFSNGSEIILKDLFLYPADPEFTSLGSLEVTDIFFDELPEITEKAFSIARSRIRYKLINGVPKSLAAGNPANNWVKTRYVSDSNNKPIVLDDYRKFVPATVEDNPDETFRNQYRKNLERLPYFDRMRLLHGDWTVIDNDNPFFYEFNYNTHTVPDIPLRDDVELILSFDFNVNPCTAILGYVVYGEGVFYVREFSANGGTRKILEQMEWMLDLNQPIKITGDNSGHSRQSSAVHTDYQIIEDFFRQRVEGRTKKANGSHILSKKISNHMLYNVPCFFSRKGCPSLINQIISARQKEDGTLFKDDSPTGNHFVDCFRYFNNLIFASVQEINQFASLCEEQDKEAA